MNAILWGDCREMLKTLPARSVQTCVTSPPYFGLRDYGHGAQIGLEPTPDEFVAAICAVFDEIWRVLKDDGTAWLNLGDSYAKDGGPNPPGPAGRDIAAAVRLASAAVPSGIKCKDLIGIPWMVAFALRSRGWYLRQEIIWAKPNPMPESVRDRCTKAHESLFLLTKNERYYFDSDAIAEPAAYVGLKNQSPTGFKDAKAFNGKHAGKPSVRRQYAKALQIATDKGLTQAHLDAIRSNGIVDTDKAAARRANMPNGERQELSRLAQEAKDALGAYYREFLSDGTRNKRSVWSVATRPYAGAHFATFPPALIEPCILAGSRPGDVVLDPFGGSGTTGAVARQLGRQFILCELNLDYIDLAYRRIYGES